jgi:hypothetical protein
VIIVPTAIAKAAVKVRLVAFLRSPAERPDNRVGEEPWTGPPHVISSLLFNLLLCLLLSSTRPESFPSPSSLVCANEDLSNATRLARQDGTQPPSSNPSKQPAAADSCQILSTGSANSLFDSSAPPRLLSAHQPPRCPSPNPSSPGHSQPSPSLLTFVPVPP